MFRFEDLQIWLRAAESLCLGLGAWGLGLGRIAGAWGLVESQGLGAWLAEFVVVSWRVRMSG